MFFPCMDPSSVLWEAYSDSDDDKNENGDNNSHKNCNGNEMK